MPPEPDERAVACAQVSVFSCQRSLQDPFGDAAAGMRYSALSPLSSVRHAADALAKAAGPPLRGPKSAACYLESSLPIPEGQESGRPRVASTDESGAQAVGGPEPRDDGLKLLVGTKPGGYGCPNRLELRRDRSRLDSAAALLALNLDAIAAEKEVLFPLPEQLLVGFILYGDWL